MCHCSDCYGVNKTFSFFINCLLKSCFSTCLLCVLFMLLKVISWMFVVSVLAISVLIKSIIFTTLETGILIPVLHMERGHREFKYCAEDHIASK